MNAHPTSSLFAIAVVAMCVAAGEVRAQPTIVWTASDATAILSGPGEQFYPVLKLPAGTQLEVHQELPGGWLAIRPPAGSFSLISGTAIESADYRTGRVTRDGAASRVGSALVGDYDAVHVRLHRGELVEVLDPTPDPDTHLVRIAPPAGEFRWVHESNISRRPVAAQAPATAAIAVPAEPSATNGPSGDAREPATPNPEPALETGATEAPQPAAEEEAQSEGHWRVREATAEESADANASQVESVRYDSPATDSTSGVNPVATTAAAEEPPSQAGNPGSKEAPSEASAATGTPTETEQGAVAPKHLDKSFATQLNQLEIQISRRVAGPPNLWVFEDLEREAARLAGIATTKEEMATIRELGIRMSRFTAIAARHRALGQQQLAAGGATRMAAPAGTGQDVGPIPSASGYDAVGVLRPVVSKRPGAPPYALVDERGEVVTFVTPGPSVNMQAYLGKRIAVSGTRAYLPEYRRRNIQTARVTPMEGNRLR